MNASMCLLVCACECEHVSVRVCVYECEHVSVRVCACFMIVLYYFEGNIVNRIIFIYIYIYIYIYMLYIYIVLT